MPDDIGRAGSERIGLIGIDLGSAAKAHGGVPLREADWTSRLAAAGMDGVRIGDVIGSHLWLYADVPESFELTEAYACVRAQAMRVRDWLAATDAESGSDFAAFARLSHRGIGIAVIDGLSHRDRREALYEAVLEAASQMGPQAKEAAAPELRQDLLQLIRRGGLHSVYQPIVRLGDGRTYGYEALSRCPEGSLFDGPASLFRFAEQEGQSFALDRVAREISIRRCPPLAPSQKIFINVTAGIINDPLFVSGQTVQWLTDRGMHPGQVVFELTERSSIEDFDETKNILDHYRRQGYEIAIDDAGAGYSSLQSIVELNPDYVKVDRSLVRHADRDDMKKHMLRTFVRFARRMNIRTVAEGIERPEELRLLRTIGFDYGQGYLIGRPSENPQAASAAE